MATTWNGDERMGIELSDEQLEMIAGGDGSVDPRERIFQRKPPIEPPIDPIEADELDG